MGRKRKSMAAPLAGRKRLRPEHANGSGDWASLPVDIVGLVTDRLLQSGDIVDYVVFRAVCSAWRDSTPTPRDRDRDLYLRDWIALCDGESVRPDEAGEINLFHTRTARRARVRVPDRRIIIGFSQGLLVLLHKATAEIRVFNPFTRVAVDFPSLAPAIKKTCSFIAMNAAVCRSSSSSMAVVICFPYTDSVLAAEAGSDHWEILHQNLVVSNTLVFQGRLYALTNMACSWEIVQLYPPTPRRPTMPDLPVAVARAPNISGPLMRHDIVLAESRGHMLLVALHNLPPTTESIISGSYTPDKWWQDPRFRLYEVNLSNAKLTPVTCLLDRALFLSNCGCLSVSAMDLPSLAPNSIYFSEVLHPVLMHSLTTGLTEDLAVECQIHDGNKRIRPSSVRPFTIIDHLLTFCHPKEWTKGLMFHEYHDMPICFKELWAKDSQLLQILPHIPST